MEPLLHPATRLQLSNLTHTARGSYIFYGPEGIGRFTSWLWILRSWHGHGTPNPTCQRCLQIQAGTYPDLILIAPEGESIGIAQVQALQRTLSLSRHDNVGQRVVIVDNSNKLTLEAQNALLKTLEEPPSDTVIALLADTPGTLVATLRSRAQAVNFLPLTLTQIKTYLIEQRQTEPILAQQVADVSGGRVGRAIQLLNSPEELKQYIDISAIVEQLCSVNLFDKLKLVGQLGETKLVHPDLLQELLQAYLQSQLRHLLAGNAHAQIIKTNQSLKAAVRLQDYLRANVTLKAALGALALELT